MTLIDKIKNVNRGLLEDDLKELQAQVILEDDDLFEESRSQYECERFFRDVNLIFG